MSSTTHSHALRLGIREKVTLMVVVTAAVSAYLVASLLAKRAEAVLRQHELVDLGDEAELRGWEIADQVDGLREDTRALAYSGAFLRMLARGDDEAALADLASDICRRYWGRYLRLDIVNSVEQMAGEEPKPPTSRILHQPGTLADGDLVGWLPMPTRTRGEAGPGIMLSPIQRRLITVMGPDGEPQTRYLPVIWACAQLPDFPPTDTPGPPRLLRLMLNLEAASSPRHFFALIDPDRKLLIRPDEFAPSGDHNNDEVFRSIADSDEIRERVSQSFSPRNREAPQVQPLLLLKNVPLKGNYRFQEGRPGESLRSAVAERQDADEAGLDHFFEKLASRCANDGRVGGMQGGTSELRLLISANASIGSLQDKVVTEFQNEFPEQFDGFSWREPVLCDDIDVWAVSLGLGSVDYMRRYLMLYAVLDDELASSIQHDMSQMRQFALIFAGLAGGIAFLVAFYFIRPLQKMTDMSHRVTDSEPERLPENLRDLADELPVRRSDEVGDIARASQRLFQEVLNNQRELEERVRERTAELEDANAQLQSLSREKDAFVAKVSHDLRQPLNAIFLQVEALKLTNLDELQKKDVAKIQDHAGRELQLVNDILEYQKIIMGAETLNDDEIDLGTMIDEVVEAFTKSASDKGLAIDTTKPESDVPPLIADRRRLRQILDNLMSNAVKFTEEGRIRLEATFDEGFFEIFVADTGRGMSEIEAAKAFDPFVSNKKGNEGGTGLGLAICRELTEQMGGEIHLETSEGNGTTFCLRLPRIEK